VKAPFLRTGDLGFLRDGELFIAGRLKDVIIIRGKNRYPQDIESTVEKVHPAVRPTSVIALSADIDGEERLIVAAEVEPSLSPDGREDLLIKIRETVAQNHDLHAHDVALLPPLTIPKTATGKMQRQAFKGLFLSGGCPVLARLGSRATPRQEAALKSLDPVDGWFLEKVAEKLHVSPTEIALSRSLASYGLDSLSAVELAREIEGKLGAVVPLTLLFESASIGELLPKLKNLPKSTLAPGSQPDLNLEAVLEDGIRPQSGMAEETDGRNPKAVLLTGATGFVGAYLLKELVARTKAEIHCLVRVNPSPDIERRKKDAKDKVRRNLETFSLWDDEVSARVIGVPGDLSKPLLGLSEGEFDAMSDGSTPSITTAPR
jgi:acyl carrier protein